jgi:D-methionine transport system substrate-binding protein
VPPSRPFPAPRLGRRSLLAGLAVAPVAARAEETLRIGVMSGEPEVLMERVAAEALERGLRLKIVAFSDYMLPNEALDRGELDANAFQHRPYLENQVKTRGYRIVPIADTIVLPLGLYSRKVKSVAELPRGARIGIPNDPSNGGRALNLLATLGVLRLREGAGILPTPLDIVDNPLGVRVVELDAGIVARSLEDLQAGTVNTDWAQKTGLGQELRIGTEPVEGNPYRNVIAVRAGTENDPRFKTLVAAYHSEPIREFILARYKGLQLPAW